MANIPSGYQQLDRSERHAAPGARRIGPADPQEILSVSIRVRRRPDAPPFPDLISLAMAPVGQKKFLSREEFAASYGASQADLDAVANFARGHGLTIVESSVPRRTVTVSGSVAQMNSAFAVELGQYESPTEKYRGREGYVHLPTSLADIVEGVFGLDNRRMARRTSSPQKVRPRDNPDSGGTGPLTPPQVAKLYNFPAPANAAGQTIALIEFSGGYQQSDIQAFFGPLNLAVPVTTDVPVDGMNNAHGGYPEAVTDIDVAGSVAPGAKIVVYWAPWTEQGWVDAVTTAVHDATNEPSVLCICWGWAEFQETSGLLWSPTAIDAVSAAFQDAVALGVAVLTGSGDAGSDCEIGDNKAHVVYPASDPWVTACGGTRIENVSGSNFTELTWNDNFGATGGGISDYFDPPYFQYAFQNAVNIPPSVNPPGTRRGRGVPDVAGNADPDSGYTLTVNGVAGPPTGGTSIVAPLYAGLVALMNAKLGGHVGYLNLILYSLAGTSVFRDVADGGSNAYNGAPGYKSGPGWDACTGLGSINGNALLAALPVRSIQASIVITSGAQSPSGKPLPPSWVFQISGVWFTPGGRVGGLPEVVLADDVGAFNWSAELRPSAKFPSFDPKIGEPFSVRDLAAGVAASAVVQEIEG